MPREPTRDLPPHPRTDSPARRRSARRARGRWSTTAARSSRTSWSVITARLKAGFRTRARRLVLDRLGHRRPRGRRRQPPLAGRHACWRSASAPSATASPRSPARYGADVTQPRRGLGPGGRPGPASPRRCATMAPPGKPAARRPADPQRDLHRRHQPARDADRRGHAPRRPTRCSWSTGSAASAPSRSRWTPGTWTWSRPARRRAGWCRRAWPW